MTTPTPPAKSGTSLVRLVVIILVLLAIGGGVYLYLEDQQKDRGVPPATVDIRRSMGEYLNRLEKVSKLADTYKDADGDLLADAPTDPTQFVNPERLTFTAVPGEDPDKAAEAWKPFVEHLAKTTGRKAVYLKVEPGFFSPPTAEMAQGAPSMPLKVRPDDEATQAQAAAGGVPLLQSLDQQLLAFRQGRLHVTAFNTGAVTAAVNEAGFHPLFVPATADGKYAYEMRMIVPAGSSIQKPEDIKGKTLALVALSSNSGGRLPLAVLKEKFNLNPGADYQVVFTGDHRQSVKQVIDEKRHPAACVAGDLLDAMIATGEVKADAVRTIFTSASFCPLAFGVPSTMDPKLRADVQKAFETFPFAGTSVGKLYDAQKRTKFVRLDYKKDFADVRDVDAKLPKLMAVK